MMNPDKEKPPEEKPAPAPKKTDGKVFDVRRPGKALASPTSRPVIMGHKPEAQEAQAAVSGVGDASPLLTRRKIQIMPTGDIKQDEEKIPVKEKAAPAGALIKQSSAAQPTEQEKEALAMVALDATTGPPAVPAEEGKPRAKSELRIEPPKEESSPSPEEPAETKAEPEPAPEPEKTEPKADKKADEPKPAKTETESAEKEPELADKELPAETSSMPEAEPTDEAADAKEEPAPEPHIEPLFDSSGVVVSNHDHHHHHHALKVFGLIVVIVLLAAATLDILLDLGILTLEGIPHTDIM